MPVSVISGGTGTFKSVEIPQELRNDWLFSVVGQGAGVLVSSRYGYVPETSSYKNTFRYSEDGGATWEVGSVFDVAPLQADRIYTLTFNGAPLLICTTQGNGYYASLDGLSWAEVLGVLQSASMAHNAFVARGADGQDHLVLIGDDCSISSTTTPLVAPADPGSAWAFTPVLVGAGSYEATRAGGFLPGVGGGAGRTIAFFQEEQGGAELHLGYSDDLTTWQVVDLSQSTLAEHEGQYFSGCAFGPVSPEVTGMALVGSWYDSTLDDGDSFPFVAVSTDGITWQRSTYSFAKDEEYHDIKYSYGRWYVETTKESALYTSYPYLLSGSNVPYFVDENIAPVGSTYHNYLSPDGEGRLYSFSSSYDDPPLVWEFSFLPNSTMETLKPHRFETSSDYHWTGGALSVGDGVELFRSEGLWENFTGAAFPDFIRFVYDGSPGPGAFVRVPVVGQSFFHLNVPLPPSGQWVTFPNENIYNTTGYEILSIDIDADRSPGTSVSLQSIDFGFNSETAPVTNPGWDIDPPQGITPAHIIDITAGDFFDISNSFIEVSNGEYISGVDGGQLYLSPEFRSYYDELEGRNPKYLRLSYELLPGFPNSYATLGVPLNQLEAPAFSSILPPSGEWFELNWTGGAFGTPTYLESLSLPPYVKILSSTIELGFDEDPGFPSGWSADGYVGDTPDEEDPIIDDPNFPGNEDPPDPTIESGAFPGPYFNETPEWQSVHRWLNSEPLLAQFADGELAYDNWPGQALTNRTKLLRERMELFGSYLDLTQYQHRGQNVIPNAVFAEDVEDRDVVYYNLQDLKFHRAIADNSGKDAVVGLADLPNNMVLCSGVVSRSALIALGLQPGDSVYLSATVPGGLTKDATYRLVGRFFYGNLLQLGGPGGGGAGTGDITFEDIFYHTLREYSGFNRVIYDILSSANSVQPSVGLKHDIGSTAWEGAAGQSFLTGEVVPQDIIDESVTLNDYYVHVVADADAAVSVEASYDGGVVYTPIDHLEVQTVTGGFSSLHLRVTFGGTGKVYSYGVLLQAAEASTQGGTRVAMYETLTLPENVPSGAIPIPNGAHFTANGSSLHVHYDTIRLFAGFHYVENVNERGLGVSITPLYDKWQPEAGHTIVFEEYYGYVDISESNRTEIEALRGEVETYRDLAVSKITGVPIGTIAFFASDNPSPGWLRVKGGLAWRASYPGLWEYAQNSGNLLLADTTANGSSFTVGDGSTTFRLPNVPDDAMNPAIKAYIKAFNDADQSELVQVTGLANDLAALNAPFANKLHEERGYQHLPGGLIFQWDTLTIPALSSVTWTYPIPFPNACLKVTLGQRDSSPTMGTETLIKLISRGDTSAVLSNLWVGDSYVVERAVTVDIFAIGK